MGEGVESPQGADTPGVDEEPRGDKPPGGPTAAEGGLGEDGRGQRGGEENPPTAQATRMQGADGGDSRPMGGQRTEEPLGTTETAAEDGSAGPWLWKSDRAYGAMSEHGTLARREYNLLASEATEGG